MLLFDTLKLGVFNGDNCTYQNIESFLSNNRNNYGSVERHDVQHYQVFLLFIFLKKEYIKTILDLIKDHFGMVILMSLNDALVIVEFSYELLLEWINNMNLNFIEAYRLQVIVARPSIGYIIRKAFPLGSITVPIKR